jgi:hypothetical protein
LDEYTRSRVDFIKTVQAIGSTLEGVTSFATDFVPGFGQVKGLTEAATGKSILNSKTRLSTGQRVAGGIVAALAATKVASWISEFNGTPKWLERVREGIKFDEAQKVRYPYNQVYVYGKTTDYLKLDSYNPQLGEIVSRKFTQLAEVNESTAINYIREMTAKYAPGTKLANVPTNGALVGQVLRGQIILEVPVQNGPIPQTILEAANKARLIIRDINGKVY